MLLAGRKILLVVAPRDFRDEELFVPRRIFESLGARVIVGSTRTGQTRGQNGGRATATALLDKVRVDDFDAIAVCGGDGAQQYLWSHLALQALLQQAVLTHRLVAAICLAPVVLARAGLLSGQEAAVYRSPEALAEFARAGVRVADADVIRVDRVVTARGPLFADSWAREIAAALVPPVSRRSRRND